MIDSGDPGSQDSMLSNWDHPPLWRATTTKLKDPKWRGPSRAKLQFDIRFTNDNTLAIGLSNNAWSAFGNELPALCYVALRELKASVDWQTVALALEDFVAPEKKDILLSDWQKVTVLSLTSSY